jgi:hypothetical protein
MLDYNRPGIWTHAELAGAVSSDFGHFAGMMEMHEAVLILYSQTIYGI